MVLMVCSYGFITISNIRFSIPDDYLINNIISGTYGSNYDYQLLYINNILGIILKFFYNLIPGINIYTLYLIIILCISSIIEKFNIMHIIHEDIMKVKIVIDNERK